MLEIELIQVTFGVRDSLSRVPSEKEWDALFAFAERHSLMGVMFDGIERLPKEQMPYIDLLMEWFGQAQYQRQDYEAQRRAVASLVRLWESQGLRVTELKGDSMGRFYPNPAMRYSCDFDCLLLKQDGTDGYELGNRIVEAQGVEVNRDFYKNSSFVWAHSTGSGTVHVENHQFCTPVRGSREMKRLERVLRDLLAKGERATFDALFLMEHMWAHFFEEALTMKQVCDWVVFRKECSQDVDWALFEREAGACGFWKFAGAMNKIALAILELRGESLEVRELRGESLELRELRGESLELRGVRGESLEFRELREVRGESLELRGEERRLWECVLEGGGSIEMNRGWQTRVQMVRNFFRNGWKYRYFHNHSAMYVLARTAWAFAFEKEPKI